MALGLDFKKRCLFLNEEYQGRVVSLPMKRKTIVLENNGQVVAAWPYDSRLLVNLEITNPKTGKTHKYGMVYPISPRTAVIDPVGITGDDLKGDNLWKYLHGFAIDEFHYARDKKAQTVMDKMAIPLSIGAGVMIALIALVFSARYYHH